MKDPTSPRPRHEEPAVQLAALQKELGLRGPTSPPDWVGRVLCAAGDLLRRSQRFAVEKAEVDAALLALPKSEVEAVVAQVDVTRLASRLTRAADEAVEAALPETQSEAGTWASWALQGLHERDGLESLQAALLRLEQLGQTSLRAVRERLAAALIAQDLALKQKARWWVALNGHRRSERDLLDPDLRPLAWWYTARAECDELVLVLAGGKATTAHVCDDCRRDLSIARAVETPRQRHLSAEDLWRLDLGLATSAEQAFAKSHAARCPGCAQAVRTLAETEAAIADVTGEEHPRPLTDPVAIPLRSRAANVEVAGQHPDFRVLVRRQRQKVRLVIQPRRADRVAAVAVFLPNAPSSPLSARQTEEGYEFELGSEELLEGKRATIRVKLAGADEEFEREIDL